MTGADRKEAIVSFIASYFASEHHAPTVREIGEAVRLASPGDTHRYLKELQSEGRLTMKSKSPRTICVVTE